MLHEFEGLRVVLKANRPPGAALRGANRRVLRRELSPRWTQLVTGGRWSPTAWRESRRGSRERRVETVGLEVRVDDICVTGTHDTAGPERPAQAGTRRPRSPDPPVPSGSKGKALDESNLCTTKSPQTDRVIKKRTTSGSDATPSSGATPTSAYVRPTTGLSPCVPVALRTDSGEQPRVRADEDGFYSGDGRYVRKRRLNARCQRGIHI
ncbi:hypothetical protein C8R46DRAFT_1193806 [Mycena filopes]|nr:hypothetical protein C8R46DRAFT_1193806 [Mycena filopes]